MPLETLIMIFPLLSAAVAQLFYAEMRNGSERATNLVPRGDVQFTSTPRNATTLFETVGRVTVLALAEHKVFVHILAVLTDEKAGRFERSRSDTKFINARLA